jgi:hypothetical protein
MGRALTFIGRVMTDNSCDSGVNLIAVDETTALLVNTVNGNAMAVGEQNVYVCMPSKPPNTCLPEIPITFTGSIFPPSQFCV